MAEPSLSEVHADLVGRLKQDERLREVEKQVASLSNLPDLMQRMEVRLTSAIEATKPKNQWAAASVIVAAVAVVVAILAMAR